MEWKVLETEKFLANPFDMIGNQWMLITAQKPDGSINTMTASWGGMGVMWGKNVVFVVIRPQRYTKEFIDTSGAFTLTFFKEEYKKELAYLGKVSGRTQNKIQQSGLTLEMLDQMPVFQQASLSIRCKSLYAQQLSPDHFLQKEVEQRWYPEKDYHVLYVAEIEKIYEK